MKVRFERPHPVSLVCYFLGASMLIAAWFGFIHQWWSVVFTQQLFIAGAIIVCIGSIVNLITSLKRFFRTNRRT